MGELALGGDVVRERLHAPRIEPLGERVEEIAAARALGAGQNEQHLERHLAQLELHLHELLTESCRLGLINTFAQPLPCFRHARTRLARARGMSSRGVPVAENSPVGLRNSAAGRFPSMHSKFFLLAGIALATVTSYCRLPGHEIDAPNQCQCRPRMEVVFVLDTTGSMGGIIAGAKHKIW